MIRAACAILFCASEIFGFRCPFAPWVFGKMIGATKVRKVDK